MKVLELLIGKNMSVKTDVGVDVILQINNVEECYHSREITTSDQSNDWWPEEKEWYTYKVHFTNGYNKEFNTLDEIDIF